MSEYRIEYLIILKEKEAFCSTVETFNKLLETNSMLFIKKNIVQFQGKDFEYEILSGEVLEKNQRYFKITLKTLDETVIPTFLNLLKIIREQVHRADGIINTLWDDISNFYSIKAYPQINRIENLMRKLITTFMLTNVGLDWTNDTVPSEIKSTISRKGKNQHNNNFLHETDFIQLADFLFKPYQTTDISNLYKQLKDCINITELSLENLKEFIPKSNWDRYFKSYVKCDDEYLNKKWKRLYELRCTVAHNNLLTKTEYEEIEMLVNDLTEKLQEAINSIDKIIIPKEEQEQIVVNAVNTIDERYNNFLESWKHIGTEVKSLYVKSKLGDKDQKYYLKQMLEGLVAAEILSEDYLSEFLPIQAFVDKISKLEQTVTDEEVHELTAKANSYYLDKVFLESPFV